MAGDLVFSSEPGKCSKCGMNLQEMTPDNKENMYTMMQKTGVIHNVPGESINLSREDISAINKLLDTYSKDYVANNLDGVMAAFADHAVYLEGRGIDDGKSAIRGDHLGEHFESSTYLQHKSQDRVIRGKGEISYVYQMLTRQSKNNSSGTTEPARIRRELYILEKQTDGSWLIVLYQ